MNIKIELEKLGWIYDMNEPSCLAFVKGRWDLWYYPNNKLIIESEEDGEVINQIIKSEEEIIRLCLKF
jgi:hypothetical protein